MSGDEILSFEAFRDSLAAALHIDPERLAPESNLITDFGLDSLRIMQAVLALEKLGMAVSPAAAWDIQTVDDAYNYYLRQVQKHAGGRE